MSWKIERIKATSFKAFKQVTLELDGLSLLTLDGPNGYGKTSIFDAIELLLTGEIRRVKDLFSTVMTKGKRNYDDNLLWNARSSKSDLSITIEFTNGEKSIVLARHAAVEVLKDKSNNRANNFDHFKLFELPGFETEEFTEENERSNEFLDEIFGKNFRENFAFLNYLEQGQNKLLHTRIDERKSALGNLFDTNEISEEIKNSKSVLARLNKYLKDTERKEKEDALNQECTDLRDTVQANLDSSVFKKVSTTNHTPGWDQEEPFPIYDQEVYNQFFETIRQLSDLLTKKSAIRIRVDNETIEADIERHAEALSSLAKFGTDIDKLNALDIAKNEIDQLSKAATIIKKGPLVITIEQAQTLPGWGDGQLAQFEAQIADRNELQVRSEANNSVKVELARLKAQLLKEHEKLHPDDKMCPMCGNDWKTHQSMMEAIGRRTQEISGILDEDGKLLSDLANTMSLALSEIELAVQERTETLNAGYNKLLHDELQVVKSRLQLVHSLSVRLANDGFPITFTYSDNEAVVSARLEQLRSFMRTQKTDETEELPESWRQTINAVFKDVHEFYILDLQDVKNKERYIQFKANEAQSSRLHKVLEELQQIKRQNEAAQSAKAKVTRLRETLEKAERKYADQTISEIELIFHIYSGRLIQNYQRGLGLFIESGEGKQLRFLTAEKSDHDAIMSMSSGQVSALSLAFFLSLNKVYADVPLILVDDPSQSLDDVNIASLTDLLRCELNHCQLLVSSHEEDTSAYMRYRFNKAGLKTKSLNMQRLAKAGGSAE
nr:AAA family ATPase [Amylibacter sp.]